MARVAIVGAGVAGVASAWLLARAGHDVTIVDRSAGPGQGASRANGAQLSYAYGDALASPSMLAHLPAIMLGRDPAYRVRIRADPEFLIWGLRFLINGTAGRFMANTRHLLEMAAETKALLPDLMAEFDLSFDHAVSGKMILYPSREACEKGRSVREMKIAMGIAQEVLDREAATAIEPALAHYPDPIGAVVYSPDDAAGRPDRFCADLIARLRLRYGLATVFGREVRKVRALKARVTGLEFRDREPLDADIVVMATGQAIDALPLSDRPIGGIWPVQGYSITARATPAAMSVSITDTRRKIVFARVGDEVRAAGLADIGRYRFGFDANRYNTFRANSVAAFGPTFHHGEGEDLQAWTSARPCTPSSRPILRPGSLAGLYLNLGHGTLGWTLCLGSAKRLAGLVQGEG